MDRTALAEQFLPLLAPLTQAVQSRGIAAAMGLWQSIPAVALLPFYLHGYWSDRIETLPLTACGALVPCTGSDRRLLEEPCFLPADVYAARAFTRWYRSTLHTDQPGEIPLCDWEEGYRRNNERLTTRRLGANSYCAIDTVTPAGTITRGSRPLLGQLAGRNAPRPSLLVPGRGRFSEQALTCLATSAFLVVNAQQVRGARTLDLLRSLLVHRRSTPTLLVAFSPSDLLALGSAVAEEDLPVHPFGRPPQLSTVQTLVIGRDRLQEEQRFDFAVTQLRGTSSALDGVLDRAEDAWWAARQALDRASARLTILPRFLHAVEAFSRGAPAEAGLFTSAIALLEDALHDPSCAADRMRRLLDATDQHVTAPTGRRTVVLVRNEDEAAFVRQAIGRHWDASLAELEQLGLEVSTPGGISQGCDTLIVSCYSGTRTLDTLLASQARHAVLVLDPIEARVAFLQIARLRRLLERAGAATTLPVLDRLADPLAAIMAPGTTTTVHIALSPDAASRALDYVSLLDENAPPGQLRDQVLVSFTDGSCLLCAPDHTFDLLDAGNVLRQVRAGDLEGGDELVLIATERQGRFSERLMQVLDEGVLQAECATRLEWHTIVSSHVRAQQRSTKSIQAGLHRLGITVDVMTVRAWVRAPTATAQGGAMPQQWRSFKALAEELGLAFSEAELRHYYHAVRSWRTLHRQAGRTLVRLMRRAAVGQLDAATLYDVEAQWGLSTRDLVQGTQIRIVDDVVPW